MTAEEALNVLFYMPTRKDLIGNGLIFLCAVVLAGGFHYLPMDLTNLANLLQDPSGLSRTSLFLLGIGFLVNYLIVFFAIDKYFLNSRQSGSASVGTTVVVCITYACVWGVYHLGNPRWSSLLLLLKTHDWRSILSALKAGSLLACLSSIPLRIWTYKGTLESFDFTPLRRAAGEWQRLAAKIDRSGYLDIGNHNRMKNAMKSISEALDGMGRRQPAARRASWKLTKALKEFGSWYRRETKASHLNLRGFDPSIKTVVQEIRSLC